MRNIIRQGDPRLRPVAKLRERVDALRSEIAATVAAPYPKKYRDQSICDQLTGIASRSVGTRGLFGKHIFPTDTWAPWPDLSWPVLLEVLGVDAVAAAISKRIDALGMKDGFTPADREKRLRELRAQLFSAEVDEEVAVCAVETETGEHVLRRPDIDPAAVVAAWGRLGKAA